MGLASVAEACVGCLAAELLSNPAQGRQTQQVAGPSTTTSDAASATARAAIVVEGGDIQRGGCCAPVDSAELGQCAVLKHWLPTGAIPARQYMVRSRVVCPTCLSNLIR